MPYANKNKQILFRRWVSNRAYHKRRDEWLFGKKCVYCGSITNIELDHIDPKTKISSHIWFWSKKRREEELLKCQPLCRPCHQEKSKNELPKYTLHGTIYRYIAKKCRCGECKNANRISTAKYRRRKNMQLKAGVVR